MLNALIVAVLHEHVVSNMGRKEDVDRLLKEQLPCQHLVIRKNDVVLKFFSLLYHLQSVFKGHLKIKKQGMHWFDGLWLRRMQLLINQLLNTVNNLLPVDVKLWQIEHRNFLNAHLQRL